MSELAAPVSLSALRKGMRGVVASIAEDTSVALGEESGNLRGHAPDRDRLRAGRALRDHCRVAAGRRSHCRTDRWQLLCAARARGGGREVSRERHEREAVPSRRRSRRCVALVGVPNCGKTALFNRLTGSRQHVANYAGVTVERKEGHVHRSRPRGRSYRVLDLPGSYSLAAATLDEAITRDVVLGRFQGEDVPGCHRQRGRCHQPAAWPAAVAGADAARAADDRRAEPQRHRAPARHECRPGATCGARWDARWWKPWPCSPAASASCSRHWLNCRLPGDPARRELESRCGARKSKPRSVAVRRILAELGYQRAAAQCARWRASTASSCIRWPDLLLLLLVLFLMFQAVFSWAGVAHGSHRRRDRCDWPVADGSACRKVRCAACWSMA